jgi:ketosteroid isomerase-like protein
MGRFRIAAPLVTGLALTLAACEQPGQETGEMDGTADTTAAVSAEAQLDSLRMNYEAAWHARDWNAISGMMTSDYQEIGPEGVLDYDQAVAMMADSATMPPEGATLSIDMEDSQVAESGDVAYSSGTSTVTMTSPDGQEMSETMRWVAGFERVDGQWKVDRLAFAPDVSADEAADTTGSM